jgi:hypothetical protein
MGEGITFLAIISFLVFFWVFFGFFWDSGGRPLGDLILFVRDNRIHLVAVSALYSAGCPESFLFVAINIAIYGAKFFLKTGQKY